MNAQMALISNQFVYAAMGVYTLAFITFAVSLAATKGTTAVTAATKVGAGVPVGVGGRVGDGDSAPEVRRDEFDDSEVAVASGAVPATPGGQVGQAPGRRSANIGMSLTWLSTLLLLAGVVTRGWSAGRVPWGNMYEFSLTAALVASVIFLVLSLRNDVRWLGIFVTGAVLLTLGLAVTVLYTESAQLVPALKSWWLIIHVSAAIICAGGFTMIAAFASAYLVRERGERKADGGAPTGWLASRLPASSTLDRWTYRAVAFTFPLWTFAVIAGAIWAENAWGRYWGWDPKETWAFITWVVYAGYLHARATTGWKGRTTAIIALVGFATFLFNYFGVNMLIPGLHSYAGV